MSPEDDITRLSAEIGELRGVVRGVDSKVDELRTGMAKLAEAMTSVVKLEVRHDQASVNIQALSDRQDSMDRRLGAVESEMPQLRETRAWVVRAMSIVVGAVLMALLGLVIIKH